MSKELIILTISAASIGFFHTILGPDHYVPFVAMARTGKWSQGKTVIITILCGLGHLLSSTLLGTIGIALGLGITRIGFFDSLRGGIAAWALIAFGLLYFIWGIKKAIRDSMHRHSHGDGTVHSHQHRKEHLHLHRDDKTLSLTPWVLFTIFFFGPCEPLIPLLIYPAANESLLSVVWVVAVFGFVTVITMLVVVLVLIKGVAFSPFKDFEKYAHSLAGAAICISGVTIQFLGV